jgi:hypothetical protein
LRTAKAADASYARTLSGFHRKIAKDAAQGARATTQGLAAKEKGALRGSGTQRAATVKVYGGGKASPANVAFWGMTRHTGWYGGWYKGKRDHGYGHGKPQARKWVGASWVTGGAGGPYYIHPYIRAHKERYAKELHDDYRKLYAKVYGR